MASGWPPILSQRDGSRRSLHQGDLVQLRQLPYLISPRRPLDPIEGEAGSGDPVVTIEAEIEGDYMVVVSDDCDILRDFAEDDDKYINLAPLVPAQDAQYDLAREGRKSNIYFSYPLKDKGKRWVLDVRTVITVTKPAILELDLVVCPLSSAERGQLRIWLGRRFGRQGWPDDVERQLVRPIAKAVRELSADPSLKTAWGALVWAGLSYSEGAPAASLLLMADIARTGADEGALKGAESKLRNKIGAKARQAGHSLSVTVRFEDATKISAAEFLTHSMLDLGE